MPPDATFAQRIGGEWIARVPPQWRAPLGRIAMAWLALIALFHEDWLAMIGQWWNSSTYNHVLFIPPILVWLFAIRAREVARIAPAVWAPGLILIAGALFLWLLGAVSGLELARQLAAVALLPLSVLVLLGPRVTAGLFFPLCYMFFLVPFGDELVPSLQTITAKLSIALTHWSGIPAEIEGVFIDTPVGLFEVAEACSGVKFLVAMVALATLVAQICFKTWPRRITLMIAAVILPVLANGVRAWGTIYIAQFRGIGFAEGFDHIFYGWVFFALVMALMLGLASRFFDRDVNESFVNLDSIERSRFLSRLPAGAIGGGKGLAAIGVLAAGAIAWASLAGRIEAPVPKAIALPDVPGWQRVDYKPRLWWEPRAGGADHRLLGSYADTKGHRVDVFVALYRSQGEGREATGFGEGALMPDSQWAWRSAGPADPSAKSEYLLGNWHVPRLAVTRYRTGEILTGSAARLKLANMLDRLLLRERPTATLILSAEDGGSRTAQESVEAFQAAIGPIGEWMDRIARVR